MNADYNGCKVLITGADGFIGSYLTERLTGLDANVNALSHYNAFDTLGLPAATRRRLPLVHGDVRELLADSSALPRATGWNPRIDFDEGRSRTSDWWRGRFTCGRVCSEISYAT